MITLKALLALGRPDNPLSNDQVEALFAHIETLKAEKEILSNSVTPIAY